MTLKSVLSNILDFVDGPQATSNAENHENCEEMFCGICYLKCHICQNYYRKGTQREHAAWDCE